MRRRDLTNAGPEFLAALRVEGGEASGIELHHHALGAYPAADGPLGALAGIEGPSDQLLDRVDEAKGLGLDGNAGLDPARQAGRGRQRGHIPEAEVAGERPDRRLVEASLHIGVTHPVLPGGVEARAVLAEVVAIGAGQDLAVGDAPDRPVQVGLAEEAAVDRVGPVGRVGELACLDHAQVPALPGGLGPDALGRLAGHGRGDRVDDEGRARRHPVGEGGERQAVDPTAHRHGDGPEFRQHGFEVRAHHHSTFVISRKARPSASRRRRDRTLWSA
jgi:hypothetical protein